ncbi:MAG: 50S ribosomal protein L18 [Candidatus Paceibacterota bacterium]|nr:MAG: 50S ribosomal protein L18 [Candidatus Paceibacterota bacterium]
MTHAISKNAGRIRRHARIRATISGTAARPRVCVFKSNSYTYAQVIDDTTRKTLFSVHDHELKPASDAPEGSGAKVAKAFAIGKALGEKLKAAKISTVVFDRGGFAYHGRVRAVAEGLRSAGISV